MASGQTETASRTAATSDGPRARLSISMREMLLGLAVFGAGAFMAITWVLHPSGHAWRRGAIGGAAIFIGVAVVALSFGRACSACGHRLQTFSFATTAGMLAG